MDSIDLDDVIELGASAPLPLWTDVWSLWDIKHYLRVYTLNIANSLFVSFKGSRGLVVVFYTENKHLNLGACVFFLCEVLEVCNQPKIH